MVRWSGQYFDHTGEQAWERHHYSSAYLISTLTPARMEFSVRATGGAVAEQSGHGRRLAVARAGGSGVRLKVATLLSHLQHG